VRRKAHRSHESVRFNLTGMSGLTLIKLFNTYYNEILFTCTATMSTYVLRHGTILMGDEHAYGRPWKWILQKYIGLSWLRESSDGKFLFSYFTLIIM
jgi:hypothetical protein